MVHIVLLYGIVGRILEIVVSHEFVGSSHLLSFEKITCLCFLKSEILLHDEESVLDCKPVESLVKCFMASSHILDMDGTSKDRLEEVQPI